MSTLLEAMRFAMAAHKDQQRKYTGEPYFAHLAEVAGIAASAMHFHMMPQSTFLAVAWLHDCVEDQGVAYDTLADKFGSQVAQGVLALSDMEQGNRDERKAASRARLSLVPGWVQSIKCADLISNTKSIVLHDPKFAVTYLEEKRLLLDVLTRAHPSLREIAMEQCS